MADGVAARDRWLFGPLSDLALGCGLAYAVVFAAFCFLGPAAIGWHPVYFAPLIALILSGPHYGGTLLRVYERSVDRRRYAFFTVWATLAVIAAFAAAVNVPAFGALFFTLYITWSPWHYTGQNYGLAVMFLRRRGVPLAPLAKRWLYGSFVSSYLITFLVLHGSNRASGYVPNPVAATDGMIALVPIGIPYAVTQVVLAIATVAYVVCLVASFRLLSRGIPWRDLGPTAALCATQALWFTLPFSVKFWKLQTGLAPLDLNAGQYVLWIAMGHATQYLWVTTFYARSSRGWTGYGRYLGKALAAGAAVWTLPAMLFAPGALGSLEYAAGLSLLVAAGVNIHHFILDGAIWKLRDSRVGGVLIRSVPDDEATVAPRSWRRRVVWGTCGATAAGALLAIWIAAFGFGIALNAEDAAWARRALDGMAFLGQDGSKARSLLAAKLEGSGDFAEATAQYRASLALRDNVDAWSGLSGLSAREGDWPAVMAAYAATAKLGPRPPTLLRNAVLALYALDRPAEARAVVDEVVSRVEETPTTHAGIAKWLVQLGDLASAADHYRKALARAPEDRRLSNQLAWILATAADDDVRDPDESIRLAQRALAGADPPDANHLDTLAAAYAAAGRFEEAVAKASRAVAVAEAAGNAPVARDAADHLALYRAGKPYIVERPRSASQSMPRPDPPPL